jgi:hypothetical protein
MYSQGWQETLVVISSCFYMFCIKLCWGEAFFALRCICTLYLKYIFNIFENIKKIETKMFCVHIHVLVPTKLFQPKPTFYMIYVKMIKFGTKRSFRDICFCLFCIRHKEYPFFYETLRDHIEYGDIHVHIFFLFFWQFKIHFPDKGSICTWDKKCIFYYVVDLNYVVLFPRLQWLYWLIRKKVE